MGETSRDAREKELPPTSTRRGRAFLGVFGLLSLLGCGGVVWQVSRVLELGRETERSAIRTGEELVAEIAAELGQTLLGVRELSDRLAADLERGAIPPDGIRERLRVDSLSESFLLGITLAWAPDESPSGRRLDAPFFNTSTGEFVQCEEYYDYSDESLGEDSAWYTEAGRRGAGTWVSGYGPAAKATYVGYSVPFYGGPEGGPEGDSARRLRGVVNASLSVDALNDLLNEENIGRLGAGLLIDSKGTILAHPLISLARSGAKLGEMAAKTGNPELAEANRRMLLGESGHLRLDRLRALESTGGGWLFFRPIQQADWSLAAVILENELPSRGDELRRKKIHAALIAWVAALFASALAMRIDRFDVGRLGTWVLLVSVLTLLVIAWIWYLTVVAARSGESWDARIGERYRVISDRDSLDEFLEERSTIAVENKARAPSALPTAVFLRSMAFEDSNSVQVSGSVIQTYQDGTHDGLTRGVTFPNVAPNAEALSVEEVFRERVGSREVIGWDFRVTVRNRFDYADYPFDRQRFTLAVGHPSPAGRVILVPELSRYPLVNSLAKPGLSSGIVLPGWDLQGSYFGYLMRRYGESVRMDVTPGETTFDVPEFELCVLMTRKFLTPFISHIIPILIVAILIYGVVFSASLNEQKKVHSGFSSFGVLETSAAFFFAIVLMHIDLRRRLNLETLTYLESLYLVSYALLVSVAVNSILFTATDAVRILEYRDNLVAKLVFWPAFAVLVLAVTLWFYY